MTLQNLNKLLDKYEQQLGSGSVQKFELLKGLPFYEWGNPEIFSGPNHVIALPQKDGQPMPLIEYEKLLRDTLQTNKHIWI